MLQLEQTFGIPIDTLFGNFFRVYTSLIFTYSFDQIFVTAQKLCQVHDDVHIGLIPETLLPTKTDSIATKTPQLLTFEATKKYTP